METGILAGDQSALEMEAGALPLWLCQGTCRPGLASLPHIAPVPRRVLFFSFLGVGNRLAGEREAAGDGGDGGGGGDGGEAVMVGEADTTLGGVSQILQFTRRPRSEGTLQFRQRLEEVMATRWHQVSIFKAQETSVLSGVGSPQKLRRQGWSIEMIQLRG